MKLCWLNLVIFNSVGVGSIKIVIEKLKRYQETFDSIELRALIYGLNNVRIDSKYTHIIKRNY